MLTGFVTWSFSPSAKQKWELVKTQEMSEKASQRCTKTLTMMLAGLSPPILPISNIDHQKWWQTTLCFMSLSTQKFRRQGRKWFKAAPLGVNSLRSMVTNMLAASQVHSDKKLVNHSTRKHLVQKLVDNNIAPNEIVQITGHKNINSLDNYSAISDRRQQHTSTVLSRRGESSTSVATSSSPKVTVDEITSVSTVQPSTSAGTLPFLYQCQVGTVNIFTNWQNPKGSDFEKTHQFKRRRIVIDSSDESQ